MSVTRSAQQNVASSSTGLFAFPNPSGGSWKREEKVTPNKPTRKRANGFSNVVRLDEVEEAGFTITLERLAIKTVYNEEAMRILLRNGWTIRKDPE